MTQTVRTHEQRISPSGEVLRGDEFVQIDFGDELKRLYVGMKESYRYRTTISHLSNKRHRGMVVATEMVMVGAGVVVSGASLAMAGGFDMQETDLYCVRSGKTCFFNRMGNRKDGINGKADHHRYQSQCNYFSKFLVQTCSSPSFFDKNCLFVRENIGQNDLVCQENLHHTDNVAST